MDRPAAGAGRNRVLRFLSLALIFCDERCAQALSDESYLRAMARFEAALARSSARCGLFASAHADAIARAAEDAAWNATTLAKEARTAGTLAIPFVKALTRQVEKRSSEAARYVHFGATSQDAIDSAAALCLKEASSRTSELCIRLGDALASLATRHRDTPMLARTLLQPAAPVPFGWRAAMWLSPLARSLPHFRAAARQACVLQFGGAAGTLSAFGAKAGDISSSLAAELGLGAAVPWHSARDAFARLGSEAAILTGLGAKIGRDVALLMQPEIGELAEPAAAGRGGSSSMPHKRNPAGSLLALEAATRAPGLAATLASQLSPELERGIGQWQSQFFTLRELLNATASALAAMSEVLEGLTVDAAAMHGNLERTKGLAYSEAVSLRLSRPVAERACAKAASEGRHLRDVLRAEPEAAKLAQHELEALFDPRGSFGAPHAMIDRVLADWATSRGSGA